MASLGTIVDTTEHEERRNTSFEPLPSGDYVLQAVSGTVDVSKSGNGKNAAFEMEVLEGEFAGRKVWHNVNNVVHNNPQAQSIAGQELSEFARAVGLVSVADTDQLLFKKFLATLHVIPAGHVDAKTGYVTKNARNKLVKYSPANAARQAAPARAAQAPAASVAAANPAAKPSGTMPWQRGANAA